MNEVEVATLGTRTYATKERNDRGEHTVSYGEENSESKGRLK